MTADTRELLEDGWRATTPDGDTLVRAYCLGFSRWLADLAAATGSRLLHDDDVTALDVGSQFFLGNGAVLRHPLPDAEWPALVGRLRAFYDAGPGGPWMVAWIGATPDLRAEGLDLVGHPPFMVRPAGSSPPPTPPGLRIVEVEDPSTRRDFAPTVPAVLGASDLGQPVYERMGFLRIQRATMWTGSRAAQEGR